MKVLFLTKYANLAANTRYRCLQYLPALQEAGYTCDVQPLLGDEYLRYKFSSGGFRPLTVFRAYMTRLWILMTRLRRYDAVVLHYEVFPYIPAIIEYFFKIFKIPYICDYDDAIFHNYDSHKNFLVRFLLKNKISKVVQYSGGVLAGNNYLAQYAAKYAKQVDLMPTVVDLNYYNTEKHDPNIPGTRPFTIGWIGSPSTANYVIRLSNTLRKFSLSHNVRVVLVGSGPVSIPGVPLEVKEWKEEDELKELCGFDVGIMPLSDDPWARGKCGFKLIQYMACKLPTIASPVGVNVELVANGKSGYLAKTEEDWLAALDNLYQSTQLRKDFGAEGYKIIKERYSLQVYAPKLVGILERLKTSDVLARAFKNVDLAVTKGFGQEWNYFQQELLTDQQLKNIFEDYFESFPWHRLPATGGKGVDVGCGSGRWAKFVAPKVEELYCVEASDKALSVAKRTLSGFKSAKFSFASVGSLPFDTSSLDFAYCIGVLHHVPNPKEGIKEIARVLKPGAPFLFYIYYSFENRGPFYRALWRFSDFGRYIISRLPFILKYWVSQGIAATIYWPLARFGSFLEKLGILPPSWTLSFYRDKPFYVMRTDALDRFGTRLEQRFTRAQITEMLEEAGFKDVSFSKGAPYWVGTAIKA